MEHIGANDFNENIFKLISKDLFLIAAYNDESSSALPYNAMTAGWGGCGVMWGKNVFWCVIRDSRYTKEFTDNSDVCTFSFFDETYKDSLMLLGRESGRNGDKISKASLDVNILGNKVLFDQARLTIVGKKLFSQKMPEEAFADQTLYSKWYPTDDLHSIYFYEIEDIIYS